MTPDFNAQFCNNRVLAVDANARVVLIGAGTYEILGSYATLDEAYAAYRMARQMSKPSEARRQ